MAGNKNTVFDGKLKSRCEKLEDICSRDIRHVARSVSDVERILTERIQALEAKLKETAKHLTTECTFLAEAVDQTNNRLTKIESAGDDPQNTPAVAVVTQRPHTPASEIDSEAESEEEFRNTVSIFDEIMEAQRSPRQEIVEIHAITDDPPRKPVKHSKPSSSLPKYATPHDKVCPTVGKAPPKASRLSPTVCVL
ncbi:hypothetical protein QR680_007521 [Steinernema hermaphroditum]|uniref:Uncharacterized protein n=1 Tax=Steinernema hermaphroditum TaxID=289476 RepID=A0AA39M637_9BILA|nr:hypothetical protein QR680_007521 [Steinernema hermaphroditum]